MHYFQFNLSDYIQKTAHLTLIEDLVYRRIIDLYYESEKPIPNETKVVSRRLRLTEYEGVVGEILTEFFTLEDDNLYHNKRCDKDIAKYHTKAETARVNGSKGGRPKKPKKTQHVNSGNQEKSKSKTNQKPRTKNQELKDLVEKRILDVLILKSGKKFRPVESNLKFIRARLGEGHTEADIIAVIDRKCDEWMLDPTMKQYIRPETLFNATKFNGYIGEVGQPMPENAKNKQPWAMIPREDEKLWDWATKHGYSAPGSLNYNQYRSKLISEVERRSGPS